MKTFFSENHIEIYNNVLTKDECQFYIDKVNNSDKCYKNDTGNYRGIALNLYEEPTLLNSLRRGKDEYIKKHSFLDLMPCAWELDYACNVQKYSPGMAYGGEHMERSYNCNRMLVWMFYLNTIKEGGGTYWPQQKFKSKPRQGSLIMWPADWTHSHLGIVSNKQEKYIITGWYCYTKKED